MEFSLIQDLPTAAAVAVEFAAVVVLVFWQQDFYRWADGQWLSVDDGWVASRVRAFIAGGYGTENSDPNFVLAVVASLRQLVYLDSRFKPPCRLTGESVGDCLPVANGVLDLQPMYAGGEPKLLPHDPALFVIGRTTYPYDPAQEAPLFIRFIDWMVQGEQKVRKLLIEAMAWSILLGLSLHRYIWLVGDGLNGKSTYLHVLRNLVPPTSVSAVPLERLRGRFQNAILANATVNIASDVSELSKFHSVIKQVVDESPVPLERKYRDVQYAILKTRFFFASNQFPVAGDSSFGFWRRPILIRCNAVPEREIPQFEQQLIAEMPGILNEVLRAGAALIARGHFDIPESCVQAVVEERLAQDTAANFCDQCVVVSGRKADFIPNSELYRRYEAWCKANGHKAMSNTRFGRALVVIFKDEIAAHRLFRTKRKISEKFGNKTEHRNVHAWAGLLVASFDGEVMTEVAPSPSPSPSPVAGTITPALLPPVPKKLTAIEREAREYGVSPREIAKQREWDRNERKRRKAVGAAGTTLSPAEIAKLDELLEEIKENEAQLASAK